MSNMGKNKSKRVGAMSKEQEWFTVKRKRNRKNKKLEKDSKKRNRRK